jgi:pimeloyl-ACP methyl ester carboxylesterase
MGMNLAHEIASVNAIALILGSVPTRRQSNEFQKERIMGFTAIIKARKGKNGHFPLRHFLPVDRNQMQRKFSGKEEKPKWRFKMKLRMLIVIFAVLSALPVAFGAGKLATHVPLPADLQGELDGVPYRILVPDNWNGTLLIYAHGYGDTEIPPPLAPQPADAVMLFDRGFALAASRFAGAVPMAGMAKEGGWQVKEGMQNMVALSEAFNGMVGRPKRTIIWGKSMGANIALGMIEKFPNHYDGAIALCGTNAGAPRRWDQALDLALAYAVTFGWNPQWGTPGDIRDDLNIVTEVLPHIQQQMIPSKKGFWEFVRLVNRIPTDSYYVYPAGMPFRLMTLYFAFAVRAELENRAGGAVAENIGREYTLTGQEKAYLAGLGVNADALLAQMNAQTIFFSDRNARNYVEHYFDPSGRITRPVLTLHTKGDALATPNHESAYRDTVEQQGNGDLLLQQFTNGIAHCTFTPDQEIAGVDAMMDWLDTGIRPDPSFFASTPGFDLNYVPESWPW